MRDDRANPRPNRASFGAIAVFLMFAVVQLADGLFTYAGIAAFGLGIEANPLIAWYAAVFGPGVALTGAKALALFCGAALYLTGRHYVIATLTVVYAVGAIWPWTRVLWP